MSLLSGPAVSDAINDPNNGLAKLVASQPDDKKLVNEIFLRVLNRPATEAEIASALKTMNEIDPENQKLLADHLEMEKKYEPIIAAQEKQRLENIVKAKTDLADYEKSIAPKVAEDEKKRLERVAAAEKALADYEPTVAQKLADWEKALTAEQKANAWVPVDFKEVKASNGAVKLEKEKDGSISAGGKRQNTDYILTTETVGSGITGVKIEALPDERQPKFGPGRADDGNFVLNQFRVELAQKTDEKKFEKQKFKDAKADFTQKDFDVKITIGEKFEQGKGWAIAGTPAGGVHQATFAFEKPVEGKNAILKFTMAHKFQDPYGLGRFRIWVTTSATPLEFGLPAAIAEIVKTPAEKRSKEQNDALLAHFRTYDADLLKKQQTLTFEKRPLPIDPKVTEKKAALAKAEEPIVIEPKLIQIRADVDASKKQLENKRLTGAQDLTWALINNSAFLFNH
jgi:hypothetical protein